MPRSDGAWFEFAGVSSRSMGLYPIDAPQLPSPARRTTGHVVAGRSGDIPLGDGAYETIEIRRSCRLAASRIRPVQAWLTGSGSLVLSCMPDAAYDARIDRALSFTLIAPGSDPIYECSVTFTCQPHPRMRPSPAPLDFTAPGEILNPGTAPAQPRIIIEGTGDFSLTIGMQTMYFTGVEEGLIIDSELGDVLAPDEQSLKNALADGPLFSIAPGLNAVTWACGGEDDEGNPTAGSVSRVRILPRWRYI